MKIFRNSMSLGSTIPNMSLEKPPLYSLFGCTKPPSQHFLGGGGGERFFYSIFKTEWFVIEKGMAVFSFWIK